MLFDVVVAAGQQRRRASASRAPWCGTGCSAARRSARRSSVGMWIGPPKALDWPKPMSSISTMTTFGAPCRRLDLEARRRLRVARVELGDSRVIRLRDRQHRAIEPVGRLRGGRGRLLLRRRRGAAAITPDRMIAIQMPKQVLSSHAPFLVYMSHRCHFESGAPERTPYCSRPGLQPRQPRHIPKGVTL